MSLWSTRVRRTELMMACLRILMGVIFLAVWSFNLQKGFYSPHGWAHFVGNYARTTTFGPYRSFLDSVMIPNAACVTPVAPGCSVTVPAPAFTAWLIVIPFAFVVSVRF